MNDEKVIRVLVTAMVEFKTDLPVEEAIQDFQENSVYNFEDTENITVLQTEWRETKRVSYTQVNKTGTEILLKPLKN